MEEKEVRKIAIQFEKDRGGVALLKTGFSALSKLLVEKGCITEQELLDKFAEMLSIEEQWSELDNAATSNLSGTRLMGYHQYKDQLREEGAPVKEALEFLGGFIWNVSEEEYSEED